MNKYLEIVDNEETYKKELEAIAARMSTVDAYLALLTLLSEGNREFIEVLYINNIRCRIVMEKYNIQNGGDLYRKARNIKKKHLLYYKEGCSWLKV